MLIARVADTAARRLTVTASHDHYRGAAVPQALEMAGRAADRDAAEAFVAEFPKSAGLRASAFSARDGGEGWVSVRINLLPNGNNGGRNETGIRRYRTIQRAAARLGVELVWDGEMFANAYATAEEFEAAIA